MNTPHTLLFAVAVVASLGSIKDVIAQSYPSRPITLIVPASIGEPVDTLARILVPPMERSLSQTIQIDNIDGSDPLRFGRLARAAPDGYTFGISNRNYDVTDFRPVALLPSVPAWIVSRTSLPARSLEELITWLRKNADQARRGNAGSLTPGRASAGFVDSDDPGHVCQQWLEKVSGSRLQFVPYYGVAPLLRGLADGKIDFICHRATDSIEMVRAGLVRPHTVMSKSRWFAMPNIPTADESGVTESYFSYWYGFWVPKGTPDDIVARLNAATVDAMTDPEARRRIAGQGMEILPSDDQTPEALGTFQRAEFTRYCEATAAPPSTSLPSIKKPGGIDAFAYYPKSGLEQLLSRPVSNRPNCIARRS
jgi:tripartite-type tricarboxylate transporter receptor subunit TctC